MKRTNEIEIKEKAEKLDSLFFFSFTIGQVLSRRKADWGWWLGAGAYL